MIASFYYARKGKWLTSGLIGMFASATRITGIALLPALIVKYFFQKGFQAKNLQKGILWLVLIPLGFVFYSIINYITFDYPFMFLEFREGHWEKHLLFH